MLCKRNPASMIELYLYQRLTTRRYDTVEASSRSPSGLAGPPAWTGEALELWLAGHASAIGPSHHIDPTTDLFAQGFDR